MKSNYEDIIFATAPFVMGFGMQAVLISMGSL
jgi:hypothetical protein